MAMTPIAPADPSSGRTTPTSRGRGGTGSRRTRGENPGLTGTGPSRAVIDPWSHTEPETRDITTLGYEYI
jgi:hypothetical protein